MRNYEKVIIGKNKATAGGGNLGLDHFIAFSEGPIVDWQGFRFSLSGVGENGTTHYIDENGVFYGNLNNVSVATSPYTYSYYSTKRDLKTDQGTIFNFPTNQEVSNPPYRDAAFVNNKPSDVLKFTTTGSDSDTKLYMNYLNPTTNTITREVVYDDLVNYFNLNIYDDRYLLLRGDYMEGQGTVNGSVYQNMALIDLETKTVLWKKYFYKLNTVHVNYYGTTPTIGIGGETSTFGEIDFFTGQAKFYGTLSGGADGNSSSVYRPINSDLGVLEMYNADKFGSILNARYLFSKSAGSIIRGLDVKVGSIKPPSNEVDPSIGVEILLNSASNDQGSYTITKLVGSNASHYLLTRSGIRTKFFAHRYFLDGVLMFGCHVTPTLQSTVYQPGYVTAFLPYDIPTGVFGNFSISPVNLFFPTTSVSLNFNYTMQESNLNPTAPITAYPTTNGLAVSSTTSPHIPRTEYNTI